MPKQEKRLSEVHYYSHFHKGQCNYINLNKKVKLLPSLQFLAEGIVDWLSLSMCSSLSREIWVLARTLVGNMQEAEAPV